MSHSRPTRSVGIDPLKIALGVFVVLGLVLTAVAGYALLDSFGALSALPPELAMTVVFGAALLLTGVAARRAVPKRH